MLRKKSETKPRETPIHAKLIKRAGGLAQDYHILLESHQRAGFVGSVLEIPTVFSSGPTADRCVAATREVLTVAIASMLEADVDPPLPYVERRRNEQMNIRIDAEEKVILKQAANQQGFSSISEFVRVTILRNARNMLRHGDSKN